MLDKKYYNDPSISNSDLGILKDSPWLFKGYKNKTIERVTVDAFELGSLIHLAILEPDLFVVADIDKPSGMMGKFIDAYVEGGMDEESADKAYKISGFKYALKTVLAKLEDKDLKKYMDFVRKNSDKLLLTKQQKYVISQVERGIKRNPTAEHYLFHQPEGSDVYNEIELYGSLEGVRIKGKPDRIVIDHKSKIIRLIDLKSTSSAPYFRFKRVHNTGDLTIDYTGTGFFGSFKGWCYYRQAAFYKTLIAENFKDIFKQYSFESYIVAVNTISSFDCSVIQVSDEWLQYGRLEMEELLFRYTQHLKEWQWNYPIIDSANGLIKL